MSKFADKLAKTVEEVMARTDNPDETYCILVARSIGFGVPQKELIDAIGSLLYALARAKTDFAKSVPLLVAKELRRLGFEPGSGLPNGAGRSAGFVSRVLAFFRYVFRARQA